MADFVTVEEIVSSGIDNFALVCCVSEGFSPSEHIFGSSLLQMPWNTSMLLHTFRSVALAMNLTIVCYDNCDYNEASKAYWGLKAVGYNTKVLLRVTRIMPALVIVSGPPSLVSYNKTLFREINYKYITTAANASKKKYNAIKVNFLGFDITKPNGELVEKDTVISYLASSGMVIPEEKCLIVGNKACIAALLLKYIGKGQVTVMIDSAEAAKHRSESKDSCSSDYMHSTTGISDKSQRCHNSLLQMSTLSYPRNSNPRPTAQRQCSKCEIF